MNLHQRYGEDSGCAVCARQASLKHILTGFKVSLNQLCSNWRHYQVHWNLASTSETSQIAAKPLPPPAPSTPHTTFVHEEGESCQRQHNQLRLKVAVEMAITTLRPDMVL